MTNWAEEFKNKIVLDGDLWEIQPSNQRLVRKDNIEGTIQYSDMTEAENSFRFPYTKGSKKNIIECNWEKQIIDIPKTTLSLFHNHGPREYDALNGQSRYYNDGYQLLGKRYFDRIMGILPRIVIESQKHKYEYEFDLKESIIRLPDGTPAIELDKMSFSSDKRGDLWEIAFNVTNQKFSEIDPHWKDLPKDIAIIKFRNFQSIDPVGWALKFGEKPYCYINDFTIFPIHSYGLCFEKPNVLKGHASNKQAAHQRKGIRPA